MGFQKGNSSLSVTEIYEVVDDYDILSYYLNITDIPCKINSPYRDDKDPSCGLYSTNGKKIYFRDFARSISGGVIDLLKLCWEMNFTETVNKISTDLPKIVSSSTYNNIKRFSRGNYPDNSKIYSGNSILRVKIRSWEAHDLSFWGEQGISLSWLKFGNIFPISHTIIYKDGKKQVFGAEKYAYCYAEWKDSKESLKIYQPFSEKFKWQSKHDYSVWDLWTKLPEKGEKLIITSSRKDALTIWANTGIPTTGLQGEGYRPKPHVMDQLKSRFKTIYILYDNDFDKEINYGRIYAESLAKEFNLIQIEIPCEYKSKDPSDLYKKVGRENFTKIILSLL